MKPAPFTFALLTTFAGATAQTFGVINSFPLRLSTTGFAGGTAYDPIADEIWVLDETADLLERYDRLSGTLIASHPAPTIPLIASPQPIGGTVDPVTGNLWVVDEAEVVYEVDRDGQPTGVSFSAQPSILDASAIALDPDSRTLFVSNDGAQILQEFDLTGTPIGASISVAALGSTDADGLAYNPFTRTLFLGEDTNDTIIEIDRAGTVVVNTFSMTAVPDLLNPGTTVALSPEGLAIDYRTGALFLAGGNVNRAVFEIIGIVQVGGGLATSYGSGCPDSGGTVPFLAVSAGAAIGRSFDIALQAEPAPGSAATATILIGVSQLSVPLGPILGAAGCTLLVNPFVQAGPLPLNSNKRAGLTLRIGNDPTLSGATFVWQGVLFPDLTAGGVGLAMTQGLSTRIQ